MEEISNKNSNPVEKLKYSTKIVVLSFIASGLLAIIFLFLTIFFFLEDASNFSFQEKTQMGERNITRIIYSFGLLSTMFYFLSLKIKRIRMTSYFLILYWIAGAVLSAFVLLKTETPISATPLTTSGVQCTRNDSYPMPPEFERALSLRNQRLEQAGIKLDASLRNCIDIQYGDLRLLGKEGVMGAFSPEDSSPNDLKIYIDNIYVFNDDLLTAILLSHELTHAYNFVNAQKSCIDNETDAHSAELNFIRTLNQEEKSSITARYIQNANNKNPNSYSKDFFYSLDYLFKIAGNSNSVCNKEYQQNSADWNNCRYKVERASIKKFLTNIDYCN